MRVRRQTRNRENGGLMAPSARSCRYPGAICFCFRRPPARATTLLPPSITLLPGSPNSNSFEAHHDTQRYREHTEGCGEASGLHHIPLLTDMLGMDPSLEPRRRGRLGDSTSGALSFLFTLKSSVTLNIVRLYQRAASVLVAAATTFVRDNFRRCPLS